MNEKLIQIRFREKLWCRITYIIWLFDGIRVCRMLPTFSTGPREPRGKIKTQSTNDRPTAITTDTLRSAAVRNDERKYFYTVFQSLPPATPHRPWPLARVSRAVIRSTMPPPSPKGARRMRAGRRGCAGTVAPRTLYRPVGATFRLRHNAARRRRRGVRAVCDGIRIFYGPTCGYVRATIWGGGKKTLKPWF